jgi:hypothetical protein
MLNVLNFMGKHFIDPIKSSEILSIFQVFTCTTQIAFFWPKLLPALFLKTCKKPWYPCSFEILKEALEDVGLNHFSGLFFNHIIKTWNVLPIEIRASHNHEHFKNYIVQFYENKMVLLMLRTHAVGLVPASVPFVDHVFNGRTRGD